MRAATLLLSLILILMLCFCAFFYTGGTLQAQVSRTTASAAEYPDSFEQVKNILAAGSAPLRYSDEELGDVSGYALTDVNVILTNRGLFDAEWLNVQPAAAEGDIAVYSLTGDGSDVPAHGTGHVNLKFVTRAGADVPRVLRIQYYVYGISRTIEIDY